MEAEIYHDMPSASWRTRKASGIQSKSEDPRTRGADNVASRPRTKAQDENSDVEMKE